MKPAEGSKNGTYRIVSSTLKITSKMMILIMQVAIDIFRNPGDEAEIEPDETRRVDDVSGIIRSF